MHQQDAAVTSKTMDPPRPKQAFARLSSSHAAFRPCFLGMPTLRMASIWSAVSRCWPPGTCQPSTFCCAAAAAAAGAAAAAATAGPAAAALGAGPGEASSESSSCTAMPALRQLSANSTETAGQPLLCPAASCNPGAGNQQVVCSAQASRLACEQSHSMQGGLAPPLKLHVLSSTCNSLHSQSNKPRASAQKHAALCLSLPRLRDIGQTQVGKAS